MDLSGLFNTQGMLFLLIMLGMVLAKINVIKESQKILLSNLIVNVTLPATIIKSFLIEFNIDILKSCLTVLIIGIIIEIVTCIVIRFIYLKCDSTKQSLLQYATICSNAGVLGNPIAEGIYGATGLLYASFFTIPLRIAMWSVGLSYFTSAPNFKSLCKKVLTHPCIIAAISGLLIMVLQIPIPTVLTKTITSIANANTFLAMTFVGTVMNKVPLTKLANKETLYFSFIRLIVFPTLVYLGCTIFNIDSLVTGVCVMLSGMPAAGIVSVMAVKYQKDEIFATKCVILSTLLSLISVPIWCIIIS